MQSWRYPLATYGVNNWQMFAELLDEVLQEDKNLP